MQVRKPDEREICRTCEHAKERFGDSCYCTLYGMIIGFSKHECRGWKRGEVSEHTDGDRRDQVRKQT